MAVRDDFAPGEVLLSADLNDTFASKLSVDTSGVGIFQGSEPLVSLRDSDLANARANITGLDGRLQFYADPLNAVVDTQIQFNVDGTERMVINNDGLLSGTGPTLGPWTTFTPTTNCTVGNGTITGKYMRIGKTVHYWASFTLGSTSAIVSDATINAPFTPANNNFVGSAYYRDASLTFFYTGFTKGVFLGYQNTFGFVSATQPFTWATGDSILLSATYEIA